MKSKRRPNHQEREKQQHARDRHKERDHDAEREIEPEITPANTPAFCGSCLRIERDCEEAPSEHPVKDPDQGVDTSEPDDRGPGNPEQAPYENILDRLTASRSAVGHQD